MTYFTAELRHLSFYFYILHILDMQYPEGLILRIGWSCLFVLVNIAHCSYRSSQSKVWRMWVLAYCRKDFQVMNGIHVHDGDMKPVQVLVVSIQEHSCHQIIH